MQAWNDREVDKIIQDNLKELFSRVDPKQMNIVSALAVPLPAMTMTRILGLPMEDHEYLEALSHQMMKSLDLYLTFREIEKMNKATKSLIAYFERYAKIKLAKPDNSLLSKLIQLNKEKKEVPHHELIANCFFLFIAGGETSAGLIGPGIYHMTINAKFGVQLQDSQLCKTATDELLRFDAPTQLVGRIASEDIQIDNHLFSKGDLLTVCIGAANRDPEKFDLPDELMLDRTPNHHLTFSTGIHRCLGDWLAKREFELLLEYMAQRFASIELLDAPEWKENLGMRSFSSLQVSCQ
jgi:cytochrome P450